MASAKLEADFDTICPQVKEQPQQLAVLDQDSVQGICDLWKLNVWMEMCGIAPRD